jgi:hypothetical protein
MAKVAAHMADAPDAHAVRSPGCERRRTPVFYGQGAQAARGRPARAQFAERAARSGGSAVPARPGRPRRRRHRQDRTGSCTLPYPNPGCRGTHRAAARAQAQVAKLAALWRREGVFSEATCARFRARAAPGVAPAAAPPAALAPAGPGPGAGPAGGRAGENGRGSLAPQASAATSADGRTAGPPAAAAAASHAGARCIPTDVHVAAPCSYHAVVFDMVGSGLVAVTAAVLARFTCNLTWTAALLRSMLLTGVVCDVQAGSAARPARRAQGRQRPERHV